MGGETAGEIVEAVAAGFDRPRRRRTQSRVGLCKAVAGARKIGPQHLRAQPDSGEVEAVPHPAQMTLCREPQPLGPVIETLRRIADQILRQRQTRAPARRGAAGAR